MSDYHISLPPPGTACTDDGCLSLAEVRVTEPPAAELDGVPPSLFVYSPVTHDLCGYCWTRYRRTLVEDGHMIWDASGDDPAEIRIGHPRWQVWTSTDAGRLYAAGRFNGQGTTVYAWLTSTLHEQIHQAEATMPAHR